MLKRIEPVQMVAERVLESLERSSSIVAVDSLLAEY